MAGELKFSMLIQANAAQAKAEVAAMRAETTKLAQEAAKAGAAGAAAAPQVNAVGTAAKAAAAGAGLAADGAAEWGSVVQMVRAQIQPMVGEAYALAAAVQQVASYEEMGAISAHEAALAQDALARKAIDLMGRMEAAGVSIDGTTTAMRAQDTAAQQLINQLTGVNRSTGETIADHLRHGQALDDLRARFDPLFAASRRYELELYEIAEAERQGAISAGVAAQARERASQGYLALPGQLGRVGASSQAASANMANLGYQFNDIGMMLAAGQSPFMLMMQQGPQVTQALDNMKRSGMAVGASIKSALLGMVSPMSLVTMGVIGLGAYAVQALMATEEEAKSAEEAVKDLTSSVQAFAVQTRRSSDDIISDFGRITPEIIALQNGLTKLAEVNALQDLRATLSVLKAEVSGGWFDTGRIDAGALLGVDPFLAGKGPGRGGAGRTENPLITQYQGSLNDLQTARGPQEQLAVIKEMSSLFVEATGSINQMDAAQVAHYGSLLDTEAALNRIVKLQADAQRQQIELARAAGTENARMGGPTAADRAPPRDYAAEQAAKNTAREMLASLQQQADMHVLIGRYGRDSANVALARLQAERAIQAEMVSSMEVTQDTKQELMQAWDAANGLAGAQIAAGIEAALGPASQLNGILQQAAGWFARAQAAAKDAAAWQQWQVPGRLTREGDDERGQQRDTVIGSTDHFSGDQPWMNTYRKSGVGSGGGGGGAKKEKDALADLIKEEQRQIEMLRITDPIQREIQQNHEALAGATEAERQKVAGLIAERLRLQEVRDMIDDLGRTGEQAFSGWIRGAHSFGDAIGMVLDKLAEMAASSAWDMIWSGFGGGGGLGGWLGSLLGFADGGRIGGSGGPREDNHIVAVSTGEYVVNAAATAANLDLVDAINNGATPRELLALMTGMGAGSVGAAPLTGMIDAGADLSQMLQHVAGAKPPAFADGGLIDRVGASAPRAWFGGGSSSSGGASSGGGRAASDPLKLEIGLRYVGGRDVFKADMQQIAGDTAQLYVAEGIEQFSSEMLPGRLGEIQSNPRGVG